METSNWQLAPLSDTELRTTNGGGILTGLYNLLKAKIDALGDEAKSFVKEFLGGLRTILFDLGF